MKTGLGASDDCAAGAGPALLDSGDGSAAGAGLVALGVSAGQIDPEGLGGPALPDGLSGGA